MVLSEELHDSFEALVVDLRGDHLHGVVLQSQVCQLIQIANYIIL